MKPKGTENLMTRLRRKDTGLTMTPTEYLQIEKAERKIIEAAELRIEKARELADKCLPPKNRRPANADDIVTGAIIWHERSKEHGGDYWHIVAEPMHYGDAWKAYMADDGCRYGLDHAYVEKSDHVCSSGGIAVPGTKSL